MKLKIVILSLFLLSLVKLVLAQESVRLEQEGRFLVPAEKAEAVWLWLKDYSYPGLTAYTNEEEFTDRYFDTPALALLNQNASVRHRQRQNLTNPEDRKSGRELVQIKLSNPSGDLTTRQELKYEVDLSKGPRPDQNELVGIIKKGSQEDFVNQLDNVGVSAERLRPILVITDRRRRISFDKDSQPLITLSLDHAGSRRFWAKTQFIELELELNEITYTESDEAERMEMEKTGREIVAAVKKQFPEIIPDLTPKYNKVFNGLEKKIPFFRLLIRLGLI